MDLSLEEAAAKLGKSVRQLRYMMQKGELKVKKVAGRWFIAAEDLPLSAPQTEAKARGARRLRALVDDALDTGPKNRYSVRDLRAFQIGQPLYETARERFGAEHPAAQALRRMLEHLARGCHRFDSGGKTQSYRAARDEASLAVCELLLTPDPPAKKDPSPRETLVRTIEQDLLAALAGALRRIDSPQRSGGPSSDRHDQDRPRR